MAQDIYDPLTEYINVFRDRFKEVSETTFAQLAEEANVDVEANHETCRQIYATEKHLCSVKSRITQWTVFSVFLWVCVVAGAIATIVFINDIELQILIAICFAIIALILLILLKIHPHIKAIKAERDILSGTILKLKDEAWEQMSPLNKLYDWDVLTRMMSTTVPKLEFDPYFTFQRLEDLRNTYGWDDTFNVERSVIYSHSGLINGNPFVICRTRKMEMSQKTYYGSKTISWSKREKGLDGKYHTFHHTQVLSASKTAPVPKYYEKTRLIYGNTAAPDLIFYRKQSDLAGEKDTIFFKSKLRSLRKKSRDLTNIDFAMMTNEEFEVVFDTSNRNNNQQYALLFTPVAQESMLNLLKDRKVGYGDDFDFDKNKKINIIISDHMQRLNLDMNPQQYCNFDYDKAKKDFYTINSSYFRAIYFTLAPILCVPMYQQIRSLQDIYGRDLPPFSTYWEHEALANFWGQDKFKHPLCVTDCILKTSESYQPDDDSSIIKVYAHGYSVDKCVTNISKRGGDGRMHNVPVEWDNYQRVTGTGEIIIKEDRSVNDNFSSQNQRLNHINEILKDSKLKIYRRHIASKIKTTGSNK